MDDEEKTGEGPGTSLLEEKGEPETPEVPAAPVETPVTSEEVLEGSKAEPETPPTPTQVTEIPPTPAEVPTPPPESEDLKLLKEQLQQQGEKYTKLEEQVQQQGEEYIALKNQVQTKHEELKSKASLGKKLGAVGVAFGLLGTAVAVYEADQVKKANQQINDLYGITHDDFISLNEKITKLDKDIASFKDDVTKLQGKLDGSYLKNITDLEEKLSKLQLGTVDLTEINASLADLKSNYDILNSTYAGLISNYLTLNRTVKDLKAKPDLQGNVSALEGKVSELENLKTNIATIEGQLRVYDTKISTLEGQITNITTEKEIELTKEQFVSVYNTIGQDAQYLMDGGQFANFTDGNASNYELNNTLAAKVTPTKITYRVHDPAGTIFERAVDITQNLYDKIKGLAGG